MQPIWHRAPFLRLVFALMLGVIVGFYLPAQFLMFYVLAAGGLVLLTILLHFAKKWKYPWYALMFGVILTWTFIFVGAAISVHQSVKKKFDIDVTGKPESYIAELAEYPLRKEKSTHLVLTNVRVKQESGYHIISSAQILAYASNDLLIDTLEPGDLLHFKGRINIHKAPVNPHQFDYGKYLQRNGIAATVFLQKNVVVYRPKQKSWSVKKFFARVQKYGIDVFKEQDLGDRELGVASALILGQRSLLLPDTRQAFTNAGAIHVLAVSGLHVGIIYIALVSVLNKLLPAERFKYFKLTIILICLWFYAGVTGFSPSVLRAATMFSFIAMGKLGGVRANIYNMLAASAFFLIAINPSIILEVGFQLSYLAVTGIVFFFEPIYKLLLFKSRVLDWIWSLMVVSFSAQLATFPISIYYFGQFPNYFLLANLIVIPGAMFSLWGGLILIGVHAVPIINTIAGYALKLILFLLVNFIEWVSSLPFAISQNLHFGLAAMLLIYLLIIFIVKAFVNPSRGAVKVPLTIMIVLVAMWSYRQMTISKSTILGVMDIGNKPAVVVKKGKNITILSDEIDVDIQQRAMHALGGYLIKSGTGKLNWGDLNSELANSHFAVKNGVVFHNGIAIAHIHNAAILAMPEVIDFVLVPKGMSPSQISPMLLNKTFILGPHISDYYRHELVSFFKNHEIKFWDMSERGAFFAERPPIHH